MSTAATVRDGRAQVEADIRPALHEHLNGGAAQTGTAHLNSARRPEKRSVQIPRIIFRLNGSH